MAGDLVTVRVDGLHGTVNALRRIPGQSEEEIREAHQRIARFIAAAAAASARSDSRQSALMVPTVRVAGGGIPQVVAGGSALVGRRHKPASKILFGSEFGSDQYPQFRPHLGRGSYWFFRTIEDQAGRIAAEHDRAAGRLVDDFDKGA